MLGRTRVILGVMVIFLISGVGVFDAASTVFASEGVVSKTKLSDEALAEVHPYYRFEGVSKQEAEALFGSAIAAIYYPERGEVRLLARDDLVTAQEALMRTDDVGDWAQDSRSVRALFESKLESTASVSLRSFLEPSPAVPGSGIEIDSDPYLVKVPAFKAKSNLPPAKETLKALPVKSASLDSFYIYQDFEGDVWSYWSRSDNTDGQYGWGIRSCDAHYGSYSADAPRGGSQGSYLGCSTPYPRSFDIYMYSEACQQVLPNWQAYLEFQFKASIDQGGQDSFGVFAEDSQGELWGWLYWGNFSQWYELTFNLRQWYGVGDLGENYCNTLYLNLASDSVSGSGYGARVDDLYVWYGDSVGSNECSILADPESGSAPLTVSFRASTDIYNPSFYWRFGDGTTSEARDPVHTYTSSGDYGANLSVRDSYGTWCTSSTTIEVSQGSCAYQISPTTASYDHSGGSGSISVSTSSGCPWNANSNSSWISITSGASGSGNGTVRYSVAQNSSSSQRSGTISIQNRTFTVTQAGAQSCSYSISPTSASFDQFGGTGSVSVSTATGCPWTASSNANWLYISSSNSGTGPGSVGYSVDENYGSARTGTLTVAGRTFTASQSAAGGGGGSHVYQVAGVAHAGGAGGSVWRSTLSITNRSGSTADVTLAYRTSSGTITRTYSLQNNRIKEWVDVAVSLFNKSASSSGSIKISSDEPIIVTSRTYNESNEGTFGQFMPGNDEEVCLSYGEIGILPQIKSTSDFRTNIGFMNHGSSSCSVRIRLYSSNGSQIGNTITTSVSAGKWKQINDAFGEAGVNYCEIGYATIEVRTAGGEIWAYASVVDNGTGDPTTVPIYLQ